MSEEDRSILTKEVESIQSLDEIERDCQARTLDWIAQESNVYRLQKPDVPKKHLVAYFVVLDPGSESVFLVHHKQANAWLPTGGHIEPHEAPKNTVRRECQEELGVPAQFLNNDLPFFISESRVTDGDLTHTDVSLWYIVHSSTNTEFQLEDGVFNDARWWSIEQISQTPEHQLGPDVSRFIRKLRYELHQGQAAHT